MWRKKEDEKGEMEIEEDRASVERCYPVLRDGVDKRTVSDEIIPVLQGFYGHYPSYLRQAPPFDSVLTST